MNTDMRKNYLKPDSLQILLTIRGIVCESEPIKSNNGMGFGGTDIDGGKEPEARRNIWYDEDGLPSEMPLEEL